MTQTKEEFLKRHKSANLEWKILICFTILNLRTSMDQRIR